MCTNSLYQLQSIVGIAARLVVQVDSVMPAYSSHLGSTVRTKSLYSIISSNGILYDLLSSVVL